MEQVFLKLLLHFFFCELIRKVEFPFFFGGFVTKTVKPKENKGTKKREPNSKSSTSKQTFWEEVFHFVLFFEKDDKKMVLSLPNKTSFLRQKLSSSEMGPTFLFF